MPLGLKRGLPLYRKARSAGLLIKTPGSSISGKATGRIHQKTSKLRPFGLAVVDYRQNRILHFINTHLRAIDHDSVLCRLEG